MKNYSNLYLYSKENKLKTIFVCSGEDMKGVLGFFLYEIDAIELRAWVLTEK